MKFLVSDGEHFRDQTKDFPYASELASSKILVVCADSKNRIVGACGIRSLLNVMAGFYVEKEYRKSGLGKKLFGETLRAAEKRRLGFVTFTVSPDNVAFHIVRKFGFKEGIFLKRSRQYLMMRPLSFVWKLPIAFFFRLCSLLPNVFLSYTHSWLFRRTVKFSG